MVRPKKHRFCRRYRADRVYKPQGIPMKEIESVNISLDQFEAMRLCDALGLSQVEAGEKMGVSRGTIQRLLYNARRQIVNAIIDKQAIIINLKNIDKEKIEC